MKKLKIAAFVSAFALLGSVWADTPNWFDGKIVEGWPSADGMNGTWSDNATDLATLETDSESNHQLSLDAGTDTLAFTATTPKTLGAGTSSVTYNTTVKFYPYSAMPTDPVDTDAKAGAIAAPSATFGGENCLYVLARVGSDTTNMWTVATDDNGNPVTISSETACGLQVTIAKSSTANVLSVTYTVDTFSKTYEVYSTSATTSMACYSGSGYISALTGDAVAETKTFTISQDALDAAHLAVVSVAGATENAGVYTVAYGQDVTITFEATGTYAISSDTAQATYTYASLPSTISTFGDVTTGEGKAKIGTKYYISLNKALDAATKGDTVELVASHSGAGYTFAQDKFGYGDGEGLTINFAGFTYTLTDGKATGEKKAYAISWGNKVTFTNGKLVADTTYAASITTFFQLYGHGLVLNDMDLDASNWTTAGGIALTHLNSTIDITGDTSIEKPADIAFCSIKSGKYTQNESSEEINYNPGTITVNTTGTINGDVYLCGGKLVKTAGTFANATFYWGRCRWSLFEDGDAQEAGFVAKTGTMPADQPAASVYAVGGILYTAFDSAFADTTYSPVSAIKDLAANVEVPANKTLVMGEFDVGSYTITLNEGSTVTSDEQIASSSFVVVPAGKQVKETAIEEGGYSYALEDVATGTVFTIAATSGLTFMVDGAETAVEGPISTVEKAANDTITIEIVYDTSTIKKPVRNGTLGNLEITNSDFEEGVYTYTVTGNETVTEFTFTVADAKDSDKVQPADLIPEDTDPTVASEATDAINALAKDTSGSASPSTARVKKIAGWMESNSKVTAAAIAEADAQDLEDAFLLNCEEITDEKIEAAKAAFKFPEIEVGKVPAYETLNGVNGTVTTKGSNDISDPNGWTAIDGESGDPTSYKFFKAELTK